jgi:hypothetical protein
MMNDDINPSETPQSLKRPLDVVLADEPQTPRPVQPNDPAAAEANEVKANGVNGTKGVHQETSDSREPASKRVKLDDGKSASESQKADARDKVKGVALVKEE